MTTINFTYYATITISSDEVGVMIDGLLKDTHLVARKSIVRLLKKNYPGKKVKVV